MKTSKVTIFFIKNAILNYFLSYDIEKYELLSFNLLRQLQLYIDSNTLKSLSRYVYTLSSIESRSIFFVPYRLTQKNN